mgnify:CR=1 FL=1
MSEMINDGGGARKKIAIFTIDRYKVLISLLLHARVTDPSYSLLAALQKWVDQPKT